MSKLIAGHRDRKIRRCVDVVELLADVATGLADVVIVDADFPVSTYGRSPHDRHSAGHRRQRRRGWRGTPTSARSTVGIDPRSPAVAVDQVYALIGSATPATAQPNPVALSPGADPEAETDQQILAGRAVACAGPAGAPGRTTVALAGGGMWRVGCRLDRH